MKNCHISRVRVKVLLAEREMTLSDLGRKVGCTTHALSQIINGQRPNSKLKPLIAKALGVSLKEILLKHAPEPGAQPSRHAA